jgi:phosphatidylserine decarboxylase
MITWITSNLLWSQALYIGVALAAGSLGFWFLFKPLSYLCIILFLFSFYFFRNPVRVCVPALHDSSVLICPADGKVVAIEQGDFGNGCTQKVGIFLSPLDVHVQWAPTGGTVSDIVYKPGSFVMAFLPKSSELNERNTISITDQQGRTIMVSQIAGTIARQICCWVVKNQPISAGEKFGMIRFGSRVELFVPANVTISVAIDERVYGGQTMLGYWR